MTGAPSSHRRVLQMRLVVEAHDYDEAGPKPVTTLGVIVAEYLAAGQSPYKAKKAW